jgi:60 kDa SS-A/Ro ribonucleoprotein
MPNQALFGSTANRFVPATAVNDAGGKAYARTDEAALALYALTGTFNSTFYATAENHLERVTELCASVDPKFIAQLAVYARQHGHMKDVPAFLVSMLAKQDVKLCASVFDRVIDNGKMLRNFAQIVRSGTVGRKSFGSRPKALIQNWLSSRSVEVLFKQSIGDKPSLADVVKMVHPKPADQSQSDFFGWLLGKKIDIEKLPEIIRQWEAFKVFPGNELPNAPFEMLTNIATTKEHWTALALRSTWTQLRMNLNTFARHGVFEDQTVVRKLAAKLADADEVRKAKAFPYQLFAAYKFAASDTPQILKNALQQAMEVACENVPTLNGNVVIMLDASGSMHSPVTGTRPGATTVMNCIDVAALFASAIVRKNPLARVMVFGETVQSRTPLNPMDSILTNAEKLSALNLGGTNCSAPLTALNWHKAEVDTAIFVSDNESWIDSSGYRGTGVMEQWLILKARCPKAKLACIDLTPNKTAQVTNDILSVGGFSDHVFDLLKSFEQGNTGDALVKRIKEIAV